LGRLLDTEAEYRLTNWSYRINHICEGDYDGTEIVVDNLLLNPDELKDLKIGDVACVGVAKVKDVNSRWNDGQLRICQS
jgi:hypothetical protein